MLRPLPLPDRSSGVLEGGEDVAGEQVLKALGWSINITRLASSNSRQKNSVSFGLRVASSRGWFRGSDGFGQGFIKGMCGLGKFFNPYSFRLP